MKTAHWFVLLAAVATGCKGPIETVMTGEMTTVMPPVADGGPLVEMPVAPGKACGGPTVAVLDVDGLLVNNPLVGFSSLGENPVALFREKLDRIAADPCMRAVVLRINSPGGGVTATDIMWRDLQNFKARTRLPVIACLMDLGTGGAYYLATAADQIVAHPTTITGGIGVIFNRYNLRDALLQFNIDSAPIKAGRFIEMGSAVEGMTPEDDELRAQSLGKLQQIADEFHARFRNVVVQARPALDENAEVFDGRVFTAGQAQSYRLIDEIGYLDDAIAVARLMAGEPAARVVLLHRSNDKARSVYAISPNEPKSNLLPLSIPGLDRTRLPTFMYIWQPEPTIDRLSGR